MTKNFYSDISASGRTITTGTITATSAANLSNPLLTRIDSGAEGGQLNFARSSDGNQYWYIDTYGSTTTPDLRIIENSTERFRLGTGGVIYINGSAGTNGQILMSTGPSTAAAWTTPPYGYTAIASTPFSGTVPAFTSIPQTYKKLVVQIVFSSMGTFSGALNLTVNSSASCAFTTYLVGATTATTSTASTTVSLSNGTVTAGYAYTVEMPNYTGSNPIMWISGGNGGSVQAKWGVASTTAAITQVSFSAGTSWGTAAGTAYLYGVN